MRASVDATFIPRTPAAARPITRTSFSSNCIAFPPRETRSILSVPSVTRTHQRASPSCGFMTMSPLERIFATSAISILFTTAFLDMRHRFFPSVHVRSSTVVIDSSFARVRNWTTGCPFAVLCISGISYVGRRNTRPVFVKNIRIL